MRIKNQDEILDLKVRKKIIEDIEGNENKRRKKNAFRRHKCLKDQTADEVIRMLQLQFSEQTVNEMSYAITNLSIVKKVIKKLARVYKDGVKRTIDENEDATGRLRDLEEILKMNARLKTQNRYTRLHKISTCYLKPCPFVDNEGVEYMRVRPTVLAPYLYDVVEDFYDRTQPLVYVLSNYNPDEVVFTTSDPARVRDRRTINGPENILGQQRSYGDRRDQSIADAKEDEGEKPNGKEYVWWTGKYHFTTNSLGQVVTKQGDVLDEFMFNSEDERIFNQIEELPFVDTAIDQDNSYWPEGGDDLVDGSIVVNSLMTQVNHIGVVQGYGQMWMSGKNLPDNVEVGPTSVIKLEHEVSSEDPQPQVGVIQANPPLTELQDSILSQVALILTTNDLSTSGVSANLDGGMNFPSGVAMMIDKAESMEDVQDEREVFADAERKIWSIVAKFMQMFNEEQLLDPELQDLILPEEFDLTLEFGDPMVISTESERLEAIAKRKELALNTQLELIMMDRKDFDEDMARAKLEEIEAERQARMEAFSPMMGESDGNQDDEDERDEQQDEQRDGPVRRGDSDTESEA